MSDLTFIGVNERAYKYIRQFTIKSVDDALVELITNSIDAYNKTMIDTRLIEIDVIGNDTIQVRDHAIGLTAEEMEKCFLQVGDYTADNTSRGFFSRGAKDISAIGNIYFNSIKDGQYSLCLLNTDAYGGILVRNTNATDEIRSEIKIPAPNNGVEVTIKLLPNFCGMNIDSLYSTIKNLGTLRDIMTDTNNIIMMRKYDLNGNIVFENIIRYIYPQSETILDIIYNIPNYPNEQAQFVVKKTTVPLDQPVKETVMEFGFLIKDSSTIYEVGTIDNRFRWSPYINYLYGYIKSDSIKKYLLDYDKNGPSEKNPYPIIDPSRLTGVNKMHPLIENILSIPRVRLDLILRELNSQISAKSVTIEDIDELMNELSEYGLHIIEKEEINVKFTSNYDTKLVQAVINDRSKYITYENSYMMTDKYVNNEISTDKYVEQEISKIEDGLYPGYSYVVGPENNIIQIPDSNTIQDSSINIMELIKDNNIEIAENQPYIYRMSSTGKLIKTYIYSKGNIENVTNEEESDLLIKTKQFSIEFINDLNSTHRYQIDYTNGVKIKLNINNPIIKKNMAMDVDTLGATISISKVASTSSLVFFKELITDILATIIVESDTENGKLIFDSSNINNVKKANEYYNSVVSRIEIPVNNILNKYIQNNTNRKIQQVYSTIESVKNQIYSGINSSENTIDLNQFEADIKMAVQTSIE